ncbi:DUF4241 domain-containing protein [Amycolatopsis pittospori]|uniref:DUF4241 domain-containing protein n=1 Tax=Amycolatopsis pittospori TaxID=2749434 RepID=UPI0015F01C9B|nr:DUF4241 domain-containing protein [Amycolatopsis pittospori]
MGMRAKIAIGLVIAAFAAACVGFELWPRGQSAAQVEQQEPQRPVRRDGFDDLFRDGLKVRVTLENRPEAIVEVAELGELDLPSGRLVAGDPSYGGSSAMPGPFLVTVPPGGYPVSVAKVRLTDDDGGEYRRIAAARVRVRAEPVVRWELALTEGDDPAKAKAGEVYGYGVDSGIGSFLDATAAPALPRLVGDSGEGPLMKLFENDGIGGAHLIRDGGAAVAAFISGWGDGGYPTWIGYTDRGQVARFVTDFHVIG